MLQTTKPHTTRVVCLCRIGGLLLAAYATVDKFDFAAYSRYPSLAKPQQCSACVTDYQATNPASSMFVQYQQAKPYEWATVDKFDFAAYSRQLSLAKPQQCSACVTDTCAIDSTSSMFVQYQQAKPYEWAAVDKFDFAAYSRQILLEFR